jgi:sulfite exporter TauE/SafE
MTDLAVLTTALMAGLLGSGHCFGMCGGIAGSLGVLTGQGGRRTSFAAALVFNIGRLGGYAILGAFAGWLLAGSGEMLSIPGWSRWLRIMTAALILMVGLRFLFDWRGLDRIERLGAGVWKRIMPLAIRASALPGSVGRLALGLCWGFLPCGLVYTVLLTAASTGKATTGASVMLAFGVGTLPAMLGLTLAAPALDTILRDKTFRRFIGLGLVILAAWAMLTAIGGMGGGGHQHH